ncbi:MAG: TIGR02646 family protein [Alphaproteobacteria bacterium]|nr:TIGR02646 family protein [Alphaproteobacteria bacterium]MCB9792110.1 TIGR02646 family protein [Alphaproteobacteria bacterium]
MKRIAGLAEEPDGLRRWRQGCSPSAWDWDAFRDGAPEAANELREALCAAQRGLCAYCEINVGDVRPMRVEHFRPKGRDPARHLDHRNLLAVCMGGTQRYPAHPATEGHYRESGDPTCDAAKRSKEPEAIGLTDPRRVPAAPCPFKLNREGELHAHGGRCQEAGLDARELERAIQALNLNEARLSEGRRAVLRELDTLDAPEAMSAEDWLRDVEAQLAPGVDGALQRFWTARRLWLDAPAEAWIAAHGEVFRAPS